MIVVHTEIPFDPDRLDEALALVEDVTERSQEETGTVRYRAARDLQRPHVVQFFEQYEDEAAAVAHQETDHYRRFNERLPDLVDGEIETVQIVLDDDPGTYRFTAEEAADSVS